VTTAERDYTQGPSPRGEQGGPQVPPRQPAVVMTAPRQCEGHHYLVTFYVAGVKQANPLVTYALTVGAAMNRATLAAVRRSDLTGREHTFTVAVAA
jgi:hypothetical protein